MTLPTETNVAEREIAYLDQEDGSLVIRHSLDTTVAEELNASIKVAQEGGESVSASFMPEGYAIACNIPLIALEHWLRVSDYTFQEFLCSSDGDEIDVAFRAWVNEVEQMHWRCVDKI